MLLTEINAYMKSFFPEERELFNLYSALFVNMKFTLRKHKEKKSANKNLYLSVSLELTTKKSSFKDRNILFLS